MMKFKLWLNRNAIKIIFILIFVIIFYYLIRQSDEYYERRMNDMENLKNVTADLEDDEEYDEDTIIDNMNLSQIDESSDEYKIVEKSVKKLLNAIYMAETNPNDISLRKSLYDMVTEGFNLSVSDTDEVIDTENILDFILYVDNVNSYSIEDVYKYKDMGSVTRYVVKLNYKIDGEEDEEIYNVFNIDTNNNTFSYDGVAVTLEMVRDMEDVTEIENKGSNILE